MEFKKEKLIATVSTQLLTWCNSIVVECIDNVWDGTEFKVKCNPGYTGVVDRDYYLCNAEVFTYGIGVTVQRLLEKDYEALSQYIFWVSLPEYYRLKLIEELTELRCALEALPDVPFRSRRAFEKKFHAGRSTYDLYEHVFVEFIQFIDMLIMGIEAVLPSPEWVVRVPTQTFPAWLVVDGIVHAYGLKAIRDDIRLRWSNARRYCVDRARRKSKEWLEGYALLGISPDAELIGPVRHSFYLSIFI